MAHYGVLGMRWGVRRYQDKNGRLTSAGKKRYSDKEYSAKTKYGETLTMKRNRGSKLGQALGAISPNIRKEQEKTFNYDAMVNGKKVGDFQMYKKPKGEMNIVWGSTKTKYQNRGYMQAMTKIGEQIAREQGSKIMTAELVGHSPAIHTVAKKQGWTKVGEIRTKDVLEVWGGLTLVEKKL